MTNYVIWLDSEKAHLFALKTSGIEKSTLQKVGADHHTHNKKDHHQDPSLDHFFKELAVKLGKVDQILLLGPGLAKKHFKTYLENHHGANIAKHIVGIENTDHPSDDQILAKAREFFKHYDLFNNPIQTV